MRYFFAIFIFICVFLISMLGFRGDKSTKPPLYIFPDMDWQQKYLPQKVNHFFADRRNDRPVVAGTIVRGYGWAPEDVFSEKHVYERLENPALYTGRNENGDFYEGFPIEVNHQLMELGREKYTIFCKVCHGASGDSNGITKKHGMIATATYHDDRLRAMAEGEIFNTITNGKGQMKGYNYKLSPTERWAIICYVRALQLSQDASIDDVPEKYRVALQGELAKAEDQKEYGDDEEHQDSDDVSEEEALKSEAENSDQLKEE